MPCYNEEAAIAATVAGFRAALPSATIYVYDNNSRDRTREIAAQAGAVVRSERQQGKGHVVRRMFADIDADIYVMADGDLTYDPKAAPAMVDLCSQTSSTWWSEPGAMKRRTRIAAATCSGTRIFTGPALRPIRAELQRHFFGVPRFFAPLCEELPRPLRGFEIETEMSVHALELRMPVGEVETSYGARPEGSQSKLSTYSDGWRILKTIGTLYRVERPTLFYGSIGAAPGRRGGRARDSAGR